MRKAVRCIHLVLGLVAGILLSIVTVSGAAVVFRDDIDWLHAPAVQASPMHLTDLDATAAALHQRWPGVRVTRLLTPVATGAGHEWWLRDDKGTPQLDDDESWKAFTDPSTGSLLGDTSGSSLSAALAWLARFHHNLWLGGTGGVLVGAAGLSLFGFVITGLWLWWPGLKRFASGLHLRWSSGDGLFYRDVHNWAGILGTAPLLLIALTGTMFEFRWMRAAVHYGLGGGEADRPLALRQRPQP
ncbi:MAG: PepSY domain-containing protein, partial [Planctomycetes bacterium]|nr:PepSY domain-containing protein [Planctomycetota bacterium]